MKPTIPALLLLALTASASVCAKTAEEKLSPKEAKELATALDGKVAGKPVSCVSTQQGQNLRAIGDDTLIYKVSKKLTYRNNLLGSCNGLSFGDTLVLKVFGSQYCRGDIAHVVNLPSGAMTGSCALGDFVPYTTPAAAG